MGKIILACKEPHQRPPLVRHVIANRALQRWILCLERVKNSALRNNAFDIQRDFSIDTSKRAKM